MNDTTKTKDIPQNTELPETKLEIQLPTGLAHRNKFEESHTQIDYTSYYLGSILFFIRVATSEHTDLSLLCSNQCQINENIRMLAQIGESLVEYLPNYSGLLQEASDLLREAKNDQ